MDASLTWYDAFHLANGCLFLAVLVRLELSVALVLLDGDVLVLIEVNLVHEGRRKREGGAVHPLQFAVTGRVLTV